MSEYTAFGGRVTWQVETRNFFTDQRRKKLEREFETLELDDEEKKEADTLVGWLAVTPDIRFDLKGNEKDALKTFADGWTNRLEMDARAKLDWFLNTPFLIRNEWVDAINDAHELFEVDPAQLPASALTDDQRKEAENPDSPLP